MKNKLNKMEVKVIKVESPMDLFIALAAFYNGMANCKCNKKECKKVEGTHKAEYDLDFFTQKIADKKGWSFKKTNSWLSSIHKVNPAAALSIVLREIAVELDKKYDDHIEKSEKIFVISHLDGRIHEIPKAHIKNYRNFAAFRTIEDARIACSILRDPLKEIYAKRK